MYSRNLESFDGTALAADGYPSPHPNPKGVVVIIHGFAEHRGRYRHLAEYLNGHGFHVLAGDLRGHGESGGERGYINRFSDYVDDVTAFVNEATTSVEFPLDAEAEHCPVLLGHSMGGLVCFEWVLSNPNEAAGLAITSPFFGVKLKVAAWKKALAMASSLLHPGLRLPNEIDANVLSHDPKVCEAYAKDPLVFHFATARWFTEMLAIHGDAERRAHQVRLPVLLLQAGDDRLVDSQAAGRVFDRLGSSQKELKLYPGMFHEILNETEHQRVYEDLLEWLGLQLQPSHETEPQTLPRNPG